MASRLLRDPLVRDPLVRDLLVRVFREQIRARVVDALRSRVGLLDWPAPPAQLRTKQQQLARDLRELRDRVESAEEQRNEAGRGFHAQMTIERVLRRHPGAALVLAAVHLPACGGCAVRFDEQLEEAAQAYGLDLPALLEELNNLLAGPIPQGR